MADKTPNDITTKPLCNKSKRRKIKKETKVHETDTSPITKNYTRGRMYANACNTNPDSTSQKPSSSPSSSSFPHKEVFSSNDIEVIRISDPLSNDPIYIHINTLVDCAYVYALQTSTEKENESFTNSLINSFEKLGPQFSKHFVIIDDVNLVDQLHEKKLIPEDNLAVQCVTKNMAEKIMIIPHYFNNLLKTLIQHNYFPRERIHLDRYTFSVPLKTNKEVDQFDGYIRDIVTALDELEKAMEKDESHSNKVICNFFGPWIVRDPHNNLPEGGREGRGEFETVPTIICELAIVIQLFLADWKAGKITKNVIETIKEFIDEKTKTLT